MFRTCARAGTAASVSHPVSHNEEEHSFDVFIHTAFVLLLYMFTVSGRAHHVKRHCCDSLHQTQLRSMGQKAKKNIKIVILLSFSYEAKQHNGALAASPQIAHFSRQQCGSWISGGLVV